MHRLVILARRTHPGRVGEAITRWVHERARTRSAGLAAPFLCLALAALAALGAPEAAAQQPPRPHIVHIVADDLGWRDVGFHGSPDIKTPHIDQLAATGVRLEQFYTTPMCTPTRAAMMTGRYPFRYGLQSFVIPAALTYGLPTDEWLLPQALREAGYRTAILGKWHIGHGDRKFWPRQRGFDYQYGYLTSELDYFEHEVLGVLDWWRNGEPVREEGYSTTLLGNEAVKLINRQNPQEPLYLYLAFNAPHSPYQAPREYLDQYAGIADPARRTYAAMITAMDDQGNRTLDAYGLMIAFQPCRSTCEGESGSSGTEVGYGERSCDARLQAF